MVLRLTLKPAKLIRNVIRSYSSDNRLVSAAINDETGIAMISMDRKPVNGLNYELLKELNNIFQDLNGKASGAILTSSLPSVFCGGLDIMELYKPKIDKMSALWTMLQDTWMTLFNTSYPTVAVINGHSPAGGCLLALACEYRVMVNKYTIGFNEVQLGIVAPFWCVAMMRDAIGIRNAELALMSGKLYSTQEAHKVGLADEIVANKDEGLSRAEVFFKNFEKVNPVARQMTKTLLRGKLIKELHENRARDLEDFVSPLFQPQVQEEIEKYLHSLKMKKKQIK